MSSAPKLGLIFRRQGHDVLVAGRIDEFAEYDELLSQPAPLRLVMRDVHALSSHGIRKWIRFVKEWGPKPLEFHECSEPFVDALNMIAEIVSPDGKLSRVKSVLVPYLCNACGRESVKVVKVADAIVGGELVDVPPPACSTCGQQQEEQVPLEDYFCFLSP